jgi:two-component system sensor kinase FixL
MRIVFQNIALVILYFTAGWGAWLLAIPPYYASLFWPSAGFALAFSYLYGYRVLPGVFFGAGLLAIFSPAVKNIELQTYFSAFGLGAGAALQAFLGVFLMRRFWQGHARFYTLRSITLFSALGVLSCIVSASLAFLVFYLRGSLSFSGFFDFWRSWFIGDVLGVLVVAPLVVLILNSGGVSRKRKFTVCVPVIILFVTILGLFTTIKTKDFESRQEAFQMDVERIQYDLETELGIYRHEMGAVHSFYEASSYVDRDEFEIFVGRALAENKGIHAMGWTPYVSDEHLDDFLAQAREVYPGEDYSLKMFAPEGGIVPSGRNDFYLPIYYTSSYPASKNILGIDLMSSPVRAAAISHARTTGELSASEPIELIDTDDGRNAGFVLFHPVYEDGSRRALKGMLVGAFQYSQVVGQVMSSWEGRGVELLLKVTDGSQMKAVYHTREDLLIENVNILDDFLIEVPIKFANQEWLFCFYVHPDFYYANINFSIWYVLIAALFFLYSLSVFLLTLTGQAVTMEKSIADKTQEISYKNKFLNIIMDSVPDMIFVKDKNFNVVQANQAFFDKYAPDQRETLLGRTGLEMFSKDERDVYLANDKKAFAEGFSEVEENNTDYRGVTRTLFTRKVRFHDENNEPFLLGYARDITDFLNAQRKLETILDTTADGLITIRENGVIETFNKACEKIFGYEAAEVVGKNVNILMPEEQARDHGAYLDRYLQTNEQHIIGKSREVIAKRKDGTLFPVDLSVAEVQLGGRKIFSGVLRDITERKKAEELSRQIAQIFNNSSIEFYIFDAETYEFLVVNAAAVKNMGYLEDELIGRRPSEFVEAYRNDKFYGMAAQLVSGEKDRFEFDMQHTRKDGSVYDVLANIQFTQFNGRPAFIASMLDTTERNKIVAELRRSNKELENFAYVTSHDLKAPLRHVSMSAGFFKEQFGDKMDAKAQELLDAMLNGTGRMQDMIEGLLVYSRVGREAEKFTRVKLSDSVLAARQNLVAETHSSGAVIENDFLPVVDANRHLMVQLFQNLIQNAIKYRQEGVAPHIKISAEVRGDEVEVSVADNGIGIDAAYADKVFQIFQRLHRDNEYEGVGIGLSICQRIVEFHGGRISLDKTYSGGTRVVFTLPKNKH